MKQVNIVVFTAFDKRSELAFVDKTPDQIDRQIKEICNTAVIHSNTAYTITGYKVAYELKF
jgi:hypothetical protein